MLNDYFVEEPRGDDRSVLSLEAIDFQFKRDDIDRLVKAMDVAGKDFTPETLNRLVAPLVKEITGLTVVFDTDPLVNACVYHPNSIKDHPLYDSYIKDVGLTSAVDQTKQYRKGKTFWMAVDRKTGRVKGTPTEVKHAMTLGGGIFDNETSTGKKSTGAQRAAILAHEMGHLIAFYEWAHRAATTNFLLAGFTEALITATDVKERYTLIGKANDQGLVKGIEKELASAKSADEIRVLCFNSETERSRLDLGTNIYDSRNWEALADQYVSRMGLGLALAQGANLYFEKKASVYAEMALITLHSLKIPVGIGFAIAFGAVAVYPVAFGFMVLALGLSLVWGSDQSAGTYDDGKKRIQLIRKELIQRLKAAPDQETKRALVIEIDEVQKIEDNFADYVGFYQFIGRTFFPIRRGQYRKIAAQKLLEDFSASELNVAATRLGA